MRLYNSFVAVEFQKLSLTLFSMFFSQKSQELHRIYILKLGSSETVVVVIEVFIVFMMVLFAKEPWILTDVLRSLHQRHQILCSLVIIGGDGGEGEVFVVTLSWFGIRNGIFNRGQPLPGKLQYK